MRLDLIKLSNKPFQNIYDRILLDSRASYGHRLSVFSGYASSAFAYHVLHDEQLRGVMIDLTVGMASAGGIPIWDHLEFQTLTTEGNFTCKYLIAKPPSHSKLYVWQTLSGALSKAFIGSCNFSWSGFRDLTETAVEVEASAVQALFPINPSQLIDCNAANVQDVVPFSFERRGVRPAVDVSNLRPLSDGKPFVDLPLTMDNGAIHNRSGLNWGQRPGRDPNQAYLKIPTSVHRLYSDFFPAREEEFTVITDDGHSFLCVVAQDNNKAFETKRDNAELGRYFRRRLGVPLGAFIPTEALARYGKTSVRLYKLEHGTYYMDFKP